MMPMVFGWFVVLTAIGLGFYAFRRIQLGSFRLRTGVLRGVFVFMMDVESSGGARAPDGPGRARCWQRGYAGQRLERGARGARVIAEP